MMNPKKVILATITILLLGFYSCCKDPGDGGSANLVVYLKHHEKTILSYPDSFAGYPQGFKTKIYLKYDAEESPGTSPSAYDRVVEAGAHADHLHVEGLKCGKYFIYGVGYDKDIYMPVQGGIAIKIKHRERKKEISVDVPVVE